MTPPLRPDIAGAAARLSSRLGVKSEIRVLVDQLDPGETVELLAPAWHAAGQGLLTLTDRRLTFIKRKRVGTAVHAFPLTDISSVTWAPGMATGTMGVFVNGTKTEFTAVPKADGQPIVDRIRSVLGGMIASVPPVAPVSTSNFGVSEVPLAPQSEESGRISDPASFPRIVEQLRQLAELRDSGVISTADFEGKKAELLGRI